MALGAKLWDEESKATGRRIKDASEKGVSEEVSFVGEIKGVGRLDGMVATVVGTCDFLEKLRGGMTTGDVCGVLTFRDGESVPFKAVGLGKVVKHSPGIVEKLLSLIYVIDPPPTFSWMGDTLILWEGDIDLKAQTVTATAYEWT